MSKSVYSLVLSDNVVQAVDRAAYGANTSRSNLINQILADYLSCITPEQRMRDIFDSLTSAIGPEHPFQVLAQGSQSVLSLRSPLQVRYNPSIRYTVELTSQGGPPGQSPCQTGELRITARTQSASLLELLNRFFLLFCQVEQRCLGQMFPQMLPRQRVPYEIGDGRLLRRFALVWQKRDVDAQEIGQALAQYIQMIDQALKAFAGSPGEEQARVVEDIYRRYLEQAQVVV